MVFPFLLPLFFQLLNRLHINLAWIFLIPQLRKAFKLMETHGDIELVRLVIGCPATLPNGFYLDKQVAVLPCVFFKSGIQSPANAAMVQLRQNAHHIDFRRGRAGFLEGDKAHGLAVHNCRPKGLVGTAVNVFLRAFRDAKPFRELGEDCFCDLAFLGWIINFKNRMVCAQVGSLFRSVLIPHF